jgi:hypothetical protein
VSSSWLLVMFSGLIACLVVSSLQACEQLSRCIALRKKYVYEKPAGEGILCAVATAACVSQW